jgi:hypothetical protein
LNFSSVSNSEVRNLVINGFTSTQIFFFGARATHVRGNFIGVDATGTAIVAGSATGIDTCCGSSGLVMAAQPAARAM